MISGRCWYTIWLARYFLTAALCHSLDQLPSEGDCDNDNECEGDLICFQRNGFTQVPGCSGNGTESHDYCIDPSCPSSDLSCSLQHVPAVERKEDATRCIQQLILTTSEFQSNNLVTHSGQDRSYTPPQANEDEPYKALVYIFLSGGADSYSMLLPYTCSNAPDGTDTYEEFRDIRGRRTYVNDEGATISTEGVGLPRDRMLPIDGNNPDQPCSVFGIHENLPALRDLYNNGDLAWIANAGLLGMPSDRTNYRENNPTQLFAHNAMQDDSKRDDLFDFYAGSGVIGRMADILNIDRGIPTNTFSISGSQNLLIGEGGYGGPSPFTLSKNGIAAFNQFPEVSTDSIKELNKRTTADSGFFGETWSLKLSESLDKQAILFDALEAAVVQSPDITNDDLGNSFLASLIMCTRIFQTRDVRGSKRDA